MRKVIFATGCVDVDPRRYQNWVDYYTTLLAGKGVDLAIFNDGSITTGVDWKGVEVVELKPRLGRKSIWCFPGWKRSFGAALAWCREQEYERIGHIESDCYLTQGGIQEFLKHLDQRGYYTGYCPAYNFPEAALQVLNDEKVVDFLIKRYQNDNWYESVDFEGKILRAFSPTYILKGDRVEDCPEHFRQDFNYLAQTNFLEFHELFGLMLPKILPTTSVRQEPIALVGVITEDYVDRALPWLQSLTICPDVERWCICNGFQPGDLARQFPHIHFTHMERHATESFGMLQHGRWLDALPNSVPDLLVLSDADVLVQRDFDKVELARFAAYDNNTIGAAPNAPGDTLLAEAQRIDLRNRKRWGSDEELDLVLCYNCGMLVGRREVWLKLRAAYERSCQEFYKQSEHRSRCQWLLNWCFYEMKIRVDVLGPELHLHGHFGVPGGVTFRNGVACHGGSVIMFRHAL